MTKEDIYSLLIKIKEHIQNEYKVIEIGFFGSYAKDTFRKESDIDIVVEFENGHKDLFNYMHLKEYLENIFHKNVDLVTKSGIKKRIMDKISAETIYA
ncbi:MAG: nucleotidyltransferase family protein [Spirochaetes bacterium]|nr:nucleotidyltransferase family protein [Spirochaetota bacterium]